MTRRVNLTVTDEQWAALEKLAAANERKPTQIMRDAIIAYLRGAGFDVPLEDLRPGPKGPRTEQGER